MSNHKVFHNYILFGEDKTIEVGEFEATDEADAIQQAIDSGANTFSASNLAELTAQEV